MCWIDFGKPIDPDDESGMPNGQNPTSMNLHSNSIKKILKRKLTDSETESRLMAMKNFDFIWFPSPALFLGHLSNSSLLMIDKPWMEVVKSLDSAPVHKHVYGT